MKTTLTSKTRTVHIGSDYPFVIIGERINPTGRKRLAEEMAAGDYSRVDGDAIAQVAAGAQVLDVNAGIPMVDEATVIADLIKRVQALVDVPLCIDSSVVEALESGLSVYEGKALVNSVTAEDERLESVLPLVKRFDAAVIGIPNDEQGISEDPDERFRMAQKIVQRAADFGILREDVLIDPLVMPISAVQSSGKNVLQIIRKCHEELHVNTVCGASNISFGLPRRPKINAAFIAMLMAGGMACAITNPLEEDIRTSIQATNMILGHDANCMNWLQANRTEGADQENTARRSRRPRRSES